MTHKTPANTPNGSRSSTGEPPTQPPSQFFPNPTPTPPGPTDITPRQLKFVAVIMAVFAITAIEITALLHGINGTALAASCAALGAIVGAIARK